MLKCNFSVSAYIVQDQKVMSANAITAKLPLMGLGPSSLTLSMYK